MSTPVVHRQKDILSIQGDAGLPLPEWKSARERSMHITGTTLQLALATLLLDALRYTDHYSPTVLRSVWRRTGLRQRDLDTALTRFCEKGWLRRYQAEGQERYRLTIDGKVILYGEPMSVWKNWREMWLLYRLRRRRRGTAMLVELPPPARREADHTQNAVKPADRARQ